MSDLSQPPLANPARFDVQGQLRVARRRSWPWLPGAHACRAASRRPARWKASTAMLMRRPPDACSTPNEGVMQLTHARHSGKPLPLRHGPVPPPAPAPTRCCRSTPRPTPRATSRCRRRACPSPWRFHRQPALAAARHVGHQEEQPWGLFLFEPLEGAAGAAGDAAPLVCAACRHTTAHEVGMRIGADADRTALGHTRTRSASRPGRTRATCAAASWATCWWCKPDHHARGAGRRRRGSRARMPMVRIGEALARPWVSSHETQLDETRWLQQRDDRSVPLGQLLVRQGPGDTHRPADRAGAQDGLPARGRAAVPGRCRGRGQAALRRGHAPVPALPLMLRRRPPRW